MTIGPDADRVTIIRRLSFDLTGVPPSLDEINAFVSDPDPGAYDRLVDRLLASPRYGERWGKYWLDASGYSDSNGYFSADSDRPLAYRYRDYVIRAFNADRPLDQIVREQLAGDELAGERSGHYASSAVIDQLVATHFLRNGQDGTGESDGNPDEVRADKYAVLEGAIQIIGSSLLGLTLQCAKCHDHKFEPVTQKDYYQLKAILYPAFNAEHWMKPNDRVVIAGPRRRAGALGSARQGDRCSDRVAQTIVCLWAEVSGEREGARTGDQSDQCPSASLIRTASRGWAMCRRARPRSLCFCAAIWQRRARQVGPGVPAFLTDAENRFEPKPPYHGSSSTGRRLALARWLTEPGTRPAALLARVLANRIWQHHFGTGLAATSDNLGYTGASPTHPELLEFLAAELVRSGWSTKALHRQIVCSSVYRQSSARNLLAARVDPDNRLLAQFPLRRLDAEAIRDAMLAASGELDDRQYGPYVPTDRTKTGDVVVDERVSGATRRSVYLQQQRTKTEGLLEVFDAPSIVTTCTRRSPSTIPLQSLCLLNSDFVIRRARNLARRVDREESRRSDGRSDQDARITRAFLLCINRPPDPDELSAARRFLEAERERGAASRSTSGDTNKSTPGSPSAHGMLPGLIPAMTPGRISARCSLPAMPSSTSIELNREHEEDDGSNGLFTLCTESPRLPGPICRCAWNTGAGTLARPGEWAGTWCCRANCPGFCESGRACQADGASAVGDLLVSAWRSQPDGPVRPQAGAHAASRQALSGLARDPFRQASGEAAGFSVSVPAARSVRGGAQRACAAHGRDCGRSDPGAVDDDRVGRSRDGAAADSHGQDPGGPADVGLVGCVCARDREPESAGVRGPVRPWRPAGRRRA